MYILLSGIVGSTAYGLATPDSDVDRLGVFASYTSHLLALHPPKDSLVTVKPDCTLHEAGKFVRLALNVNPTVTELLWLEEHEKVSKFGEQLVDLRKRFLSKKRVRDAYLGYATQQFRRLESRDDGSFSSDTRKRTAKHARHLARLVHQGRKLYQDGTLEVKLEDPQWYLNFGDQVAEGNIQLAKDLLSSAEEDFNNISSSLPDRPDEAMIETWLLDVRRHFYL